MTNALQRAGHTVFLPVFQPDSRVDLVYGAEGGLRRVQCKYARLIGEAVIFYACSHTGGIERGDVGEIDEFGVYCEANDSVYLVPIGDVPRRLVTLRLRPTKNNQARRVRWAENYLLGAPW